MSCVLSADTIAAHNHITSHYNLHRLIRPREIMWQSLYGLTSYWYINIFSENQTSSVVLVCRITLKEYCSVYMLQNLSLLENVMLLFCFFQLFGLHYALGSLWQDAFVSGARGFESVLKVKQAWCVPRGWNKGRNAHVVFLCLFPSHRTVIRTALCACAKTLPYRHVESSYHIIIH